MNRFVVYLLLGFLAASIGLWIALVALHTALPGRWLVGSAGLMLTGTGFWLLSKAMRHDPLLPP